MTVEELSDNAKTALIDTVQVIESAIQSIEDSLSVFDDTPPAVSVAGVPEIRNAHMTLTTQLMILNNALSAYNPPAIMP
jgi:hypothetical protein